MSPFWREALLVAIAAIVAALAAGLILDVDWVLPVLATIATLFGLYQLRQLSRLSSWLDGPPGTPPPASGGAWDSIFTTLHRRARNSAKELAQMSLALERFRHAGQALPDGVVILDSNHAIEWLNATAESQLGLSLAKDVGFPITNLLREPDFVKYLGAGHYAEPLVLHPLRNSSRSLALQVVPYGAAQSLLLSRDITQLDRLESMRRDFVANVSHELKTPLTVVSGFLETLQDCLPELSAEETERYLSLASEQASRMQRLVEDLLTLSALETGSQVPPEERVGVDDLLAEVAEEARVLSDGCHVLVVDEANGISLLGSRKELRSALANLASNAVRYSPNGGTIRIGWESGADGGGALIVSDNGIGIASQHIPRLTERFYRVDRGRSRESGGTGLGLAIVNHALTRHQAVLKIDSQLGRGSAFMARFPPQRVVST